MSTNFDFTGKNVLVTGGASGIGLQVCKDFAKSGANVAINDIVPIGEIEAIANELKNQYSIKALALCYDISSIADQKRMYAQIDDTFHGIDILVNNAGVEKVNSFVDITEDEWDQIVNTNLKGAFFCAQKAVQRMKIKGKGVVINISSIHDVIARKGLSPYCVSKAAINMLTKCISLEHSHENIRAVTISPGAIETDMNKNEIDKIGREKFKEWIPQGRLGTVTDVANTVLFAAGNLADYMNGNTIYLDGSYMNNAIHYDSRK